MCIGNPYSMVSDKTCVIVEDDLPAVSVAYEPRVTGKHLPHTIFHLSLFLPPPPPAPTNVIFTKYLLLAI